MRVCVYMHAKILHRLAYALNPRHTLAKACCQEIDGWFELKFAQNLQGINLDRYAQHCAACRVCDPYNTRMPEREPRFLRACPDKNPAKPSPCSMSICKASAKTVRVDRVVFPFHRPSSFSSHSLPGLPPAEAQREEDFKFVASQHADGFACTPVKTSCSQLPVHYCRRGANLGSGAQRY